MAVRDQERSEAQAGQSPGGGFLATTRGSVHGPGPRKAGSHSKPAGLWFSRKEGVKTPKACQEKAHEHLCFIDCVTPGTSRKTSHGNSLQTRTISTAILDFIQHLQILATVSASLVTAEDHNLHARGW